MKGDNKMKKNLLVMTLCTAFLLSACANNSPEISIGSSQETETTVNEITIASSETETEPVRIELGSLIGFENCYCIKAAVAGNHTGWAFYNGDNKQIAYQFGYECQDKPEYYLKDLDGDGIEEMICNCVYGADGAERVFIFKNNNGVAMIGKCKSEIVAASIDAEIHGANKYSEYYDKDSGTLIFRISVDNKSREMNIEDFTFEEYSENSL